MDFQASSHKRRWLFTPEALVRGREAGGLLAWEKEIPLQPPRSPPFSPHQPRHPLSLFPSSQEARRAANWEAATSAIAAARATTGTPPAEADTADPPTRDDEAVLLRFYTHRAAALAGALRLPRAVGAAGAVFTARFFLGASALEHDPREVAVAALYLAAKVEEAYISADRLGSALASASATGGGGGSDGSAPATTTTSAAAAAPGAAILRREPALLAGLGFDLITHTPHRAVDGLVADILAVREGGGKGKGGRAAAALLGEALATAPVAALSRAHAAALAAADVLVTCDAHLLYPPGQLALAALRSGMRKAGIGGSGALVRRAAALGGVVSSAPPAPPGGRVPSPPPQPGEPAAADVAALEAALDGLDGLGTAAATPPTADEARAADARLRRARAVLLDKARGEAAVRDAVAKAAREAKAAAARAAAAAREEALLGAMPMVGGGAGGGAGAAPPADDGDGGGKRRRSDAAGAWVADK